MGGSQRRFIIGAASLALCIALSTAAAPAQAQDPGDASVRVVHGLRGLVADVYLDGQLVLPTFQPERSTDPLAIPPGTHHIEIRSAGAGIQSEPLLAQDVNVPAGFVGTLIAHLDPEGNPALTAYADDTSAVPAGQTRIAVRHAADVGPVNVVLGSESLGELSPETEVTRQLAAGPYELGVQSTAGEPVRAPLPVQLAEGTGNIVYLIGAQDDNSLGWVVVKFSDLATAPNMIQTGDGSTEPGSSADPTTAVALASAGAVVVLGGAVLYGRARRMRRS